MADELPHHNRSIKLDILIGNDYYEDIIKTDKLEIDEGLYLVNSTLGWMFSGRIPSKGDERSEFAMLVEDEVDVAHAYWDLETIGIIPKDNDDFEDSKAVENFNNTITMQNNRYQVCWPWKESKYELASNYKLCELRLKSLMKNFKDDTLKLRYDEIIKQQLREGIIEEAVSTRDYLMKDDVVTHYLPHHAVGDAEKLRIVYEGCAKTSNSKKSLNECLSRGPNMVANLCGVLIRFRLNPIAFTADIKKAYLQMQLNPQDRDVTRFLWVKDISSPVTKENIQEFRFVRVIWGIVCSAFLLACTVYYHLQRNGCNASKDIERNLYVDNLISGSRTVSEAEKYYRETKELFSKASMNMCKWNSNNKEFMRKISPDDKCDENRSKVLGMLWDREIDVISTLKLSQITNEEKTITKRKVLKIVSSLFDPLGLLSPSLLRSKLFLQDLWKINANWDDVLPEEMKKKWKTIVNDLETAHTIKIKRCVNNGEGDGGVKDHELITFTDASKDAYAAAVYLKSSNSKKCDVNLVFSKTRLAPIKGNLTIPRLELMGVLIGCRASTYVAEQLGIPKLQQTLFTDSQCVLEWYKSKNELKRFVCERMKEIRGYDIKFGYVKSTENPADIASRGEKVEKLKLNELWWKGPDWLTLNNEQWHSLSYTLADSSRELVNSEMKGNVLYETGLVEELVTKPEGVLGINEERFSSHTKLLRVTAWCLRFICNTRKRGMKTGMLSADEIESSNELWIKCIQNRCFRDAITAVEGKKKNAIVSQLGLYMDPNGMLRCAGRFTMEQRHLKLLPKREHFTKLIIVRDHRRILHGGVSQTLNETRNEHWIIQGRSEVRRVIRQCLICIHWEGGPFKTPSFAPLPEYVLSVNNPPFTFVGLDYMGPLLADVDDTLKKNWVCLFTCLNVRALHLEVVKDMTAESFLLSLRRFIARRGKPTLIISDNGNQIKLGSAVIEKIWNAVVQDKDVQSYVANSGINWKYITEYSPWKGGFYERLVGMTKRALKKTLQRSRVNDDQLVTIVTEVEAVLNSRPLVYISDDVNSIETLTPAHFLSTNRKTGIPVIEEEYYPKETSVTKLIESWRKGQKHLNRFWKTWSDEYLESLRENRSLQMKAIKGEVNRSPEIGEVVLIKEEGLPRGRWKIARISSLIESDIDRVPRAAKLITSNGKFFKRPFRLICPLELKETLQ